MNFILVLIKSFTSGKYIKYCQFVFLKEYCQVCDHSACHPASHFLLNTGHTSFILFHLHLFQMHVLEQKKRAIC